MVDYIAQQVKNVDHLDYVAVKDSFESLIKILNKS